jgi:hypothetical protein
MKLPQYDINKQKWDYYGHFHIPANHYSLPIVQFATGELGITEAYKIRPRKRRTYDEYNIAITGTADGYFKFALPDGTALPKAWLNYGGQQYLLVDLDTKRAVRLQSKHMRDADIPSYMQQTCGGFLKPGGYPIGAPVRYTPPLEMTPERKEWLSKVSSLAGAHLLLNELNADPCSYWDAKAEISPADYKRNPEAVVANAGNNHLLRKYMHGHWKLEPASFTAPYLTVL